MRALAALLIVLLWNATGPAAAQVLSVAVSVTPPGLGNPQSELGDYSTILSAVFDSLTIVSDQGDVLPWLATDWKELSGTEWEIKLRNDVLFSNGRKLDASAVVAAVDYLTGPRGRRDAVGRELAFLVRAVAVNPTTVRLSVAGPRPYFPYELSLLRIPEPDLFAQIGPEKFSRQPVGTGPFVVTDWAVDRVSLRAAQNSWRRPKVSGLLVRIVPDPVARMSGFAADYFHISNDVDPDQSDQIAEAMGRLQQIPIQAVSAIILNSEQDRRLADVRVRTAINLAVDRKSIIESLLHGLAVPANQPAPKIARGYNPRLKPYPYDPDQARELIKQAGFAAGLAITMEVPRESAVDLRVFEQIASYLSRVGISVTIRLIPRSQYLANIQSGSWRGSMFPMLLYTPTYDALRPFGHQSCMWPHPWYCDTDAMPLIERALSESNVSLREDMTRQVMEHSHQRAQALFLYESVTFAAVKTSVTGYRLDGRFVRYEDVGLAP